MNSIVTYIDERNDLGIYLFTFTAAVEEQERFRFDFCQIID